MKTIKQSVFLVMALLIVGGIAAISTQLLTPAQAQISPTACQCATTPLSLGGTTATISNCQCGAMQCVALSGNALQCK